MAKKIKIFSEGIKLPWNGISKSRLSALGEALCSALALDRVSVSLVLTTNEGIRNINREYRKKDAATDVIAFAYREAAFPGDGKGIEELGDIYISIEKAAEQAAEYGATLKEEIKRLLIHGMLHLVGYDHERSSEDEKDMRTKEEELWHSLSL